MQEITMTKSFSISPEDYAAIYNLSEKDKISASKALRIMIREWVKNNQTEQETANDRPRN